MKRNVIFGLALILFLAPLAAVSAESDGATGWNSRIASPSYGLSLGFINLTYGEADNEKMLLMPGIDLRHFNGINVTRAGGFYFGYEFGASINVYLPSDTAYETSLGTEYTIDGIIAGSIFLMGKHGYRREIGSATKGIGYGFELGLGIMAGGGSVMLNEVDGNDEPSPGEEVISPVFELGGEVNLRTEENFRFSARFSLMAGIPLIDFSNDFIGATGNFSASMVPVRPTLRFGFIRDY
jgi:hypothetical protein